MIETLMGLATQAGHDMSWRPREDSRANIKSPRTPLSAFFDAHGAGGYSVTAETMLGSPAPWACVRILSGALARMPIRVHRGSRPNRVEDRSHYAAHLLTEEANPLMTAFRWKRLMAVWLLVHGNAYSMLEINSRGQVVALWPMRPDRVRIEMTASGYEYHYTRNDGQELVLPHGLVFHLRGLSLDGVYGLSPIAQFRRTIALAGQQEQYAVSFYQNGARPSGILRAPNQLGDEARRNLRESFSSLYSGSANAFKVALLEEGVDFTAMQMPMADAEFIATRKHGTADFSRIYGVPLHMLGEPKDGGTYSSAEITQQDFASSSLADHATNFEEELEFSLLSARDRREVEIEFDFDSLARSEMLKRYEAYEKARRWMSPNEARAREGLPPIAGGNEPMGQLQDVPLSKIGKQPAVLPPGQRSELLQ